MMASPAILALQKRAKILESLANVLTVQMDHLHSQLPIATVNGLSKHEDEKNAAVEQTMENKKRKPRAIDALGARMKAYEEAAYASKMLHHTQPMIVRLDGHTFHTFTKGFRRPFDVNLHRAMVLTTADLLHRFAAYSGYTQSDEITLIWPAMMHVDDTHSERKHVFGGRTMKISTVLSGYCSTRFNFHLLRMLEEGRFADNNGYNDELRQKVRGGYAHFDGRCFNVPSDAEVLNNLLWRCHFDCTRNSISATAHVHYSPKQMHGKSSTQLMEMLRTEKNVDWTRDVPLAFRYGTFVKKQIYEIAVTHHHHHHQQGRDANKANTTDDTAKRTKLSFTPIEMDKFDERFMVMLLEKYWAPQWLQQYQSTLQSVALPAS